MYKACLPTNIEAENVKFDKNIWHPSWG